MYKKIILPLLLLGFSASAIADDFRGFDWGSSSSHIKRLEKANFLYKNDDSMGFETKFSDIDFDIVYRFSKNSLVQAMYLGKQFHININDFILDHQKINELLKKKYGEPKSSSQIWKNEQYKNDPAMWGKAVSIGDLVYITIWETESSTILSLLSGKELLLHTDIVYSETKTMPDLKIKDENKILDQL